MRDQRKPAAYFKDYLAYETQQVFRREEKLKNCDDAGKARRIHENLFHYRMDVLIASFSNGADEEELKELLEKTCLDMTYVYPLSYLNLLTLSSLAVMLDDGKAIKPLEECFSTAYDKDKLLHGLRSFLETGTASWIGSYEFPRQYQGLDAVFFAETSEKLEVALLKYLKSWYSKHKDASWYDTLDDESDVYYGYWCFESGAIARIFGLNERTLSKSEYYPQL